MQDKGKDYLLFDIGMGSLVCKHACMSSPKHAVIVISLTFGVTCHCIPVPELHEKI